MSHSLVNDRVIRFGEGLPAIPERLLLAHARGEVLFVVGAGISLPDLPNFKDLVLAVYEALDPAVRTVMIKPLVPPPDVSHLNDGQAAEVKRYQQGEYDVVLGLLERRLENDPFAKSRVRTAVRKCLLDSGAKPNRLHRSLMRLSDRGVATAIVTTNFDLLLEDASRRIKKKAEIYSIGGIPRPGRREDFSGIMHIHGVLDTDSTRHSDLILTDQDFGEFYLRRRSVADFIYDAARLYHIVLVGYSANDPPMRYLLNAVAADGVRFDDLKERFTFVSAEASPDSVEIADWKGRGITPIPFDRSNSYKALGDAMEKWADFSAVNGKQKRIEATIKKIIKKRPGVVSEIESDLLEHFLRRGNLAERRRIIEIIADQKPYIDWLDVIETVLSEGCRRGER
jgi:NAD-dependent SIR2 family protein deacetylase